MTGAFVLCYLPTFISAAPPAQLGPNRVPKALQSIVVLMVEPNQCNDMKRMNNPLYFPSLI